MKKFILGFLAAVVLLSIVAVVIGVFFAGTLFQAGVQEFGSRLTRVDVQLA